MELSLDIFNNNAFAVANLQRVVDNATYVPQILGSMGIFEPEPLDTTKVILYEEDSTIRLIPTTERGGPDVTQDRDVGRFFALETPRLSKIDTVRAGELLNVANTALPGNIRLRNAQDLTVRRTNKLKSDLEMTKEFHRMGALMGKVYDTDGVRVIYDSFTTFGISEPAWIDINFSTVTEDQLALLFMTNISMPMMRILKDRKTAGTRIMALVGDTFWTKLLGHPAVRETWKRQEEGRAIASAINPLQRNWAWKTLEFGDITFVHYMGTDDGTTIAIGANEARFFPLGARDVFKVYYAPGETMAQVQQKGQSQYLMIQPDVRTNVADHVNFWVRSYALYACIFPKALMKARSV